MERTTASEFGAGCVYVVCKEKDLSKAIAM